MHNYEIYKPLISWMH